MTEEQFNQKLEILVRNMLPKLREKCTQLYRCGAEDVEEYPDNFVLPKLIFISALHYEATQYSTGLSGREERKRLRNLSHF